MIVSVLQDLSSEVFVHGILQSDRKRSKAVSLVERRRWVAGLVEVEIADFDMERSEVVSDAVILGCAPMATWARPLVMSRYTCFRCSVRRRVLGGDGLTLVHGKAVGEID